MTSLGSSRSDFTVVRAAWYLHLFWVALIVLVAGIVVLRMSTPLQ
jgi:hypothetical protein